MTRSFPDAALAQHIAILGKTGSGKTSTAKLAVEQVVAGGARVCVLDPIKSDWWGLISSADGKKPGLPFHVLGGPHGHVPLHASAGKAIGELVGSGALPLSIVDMADFEPGGHQAFFTSFAPALLRAMRGVVHLVIEEAHEFAPKERAGFNAENMAIHFAKKLATAGRSKGIRLVVATQRVQALHNAVLGSCDTIIAHRLTAPADQTPVLSWLKANTEKKVAEEVAASLASLKTGTGWLCSGEARVFEKVAFPRITTYDNSATPTGDGADHRVISAPVDRDGLRAIIGDAVAQAEADDPAKLKAEITRLKLQIAASSDAVKVDIPDAAALAAAEQRAYTRGKIDGYAVGVADATDDLAAIRVRVSEALDAALNEVRTRTDDHRARADALLPPPVPSAVSCSPAQRRDAPSAHASEKDCSLTGPQRELLAAITWWQALGTDAPSRAQVAAVAGWKVTSGHLKNVAGSLRTRGLIAYPTSGSMALTAAGRSQAPSPDLSVPAVERVRAVLTGPQQQAIDRLLRHGPRPFVRDKLAEACGWEPTSGHVKNVLGALRSLELIDYPAAGQVQAARWLFP